MKMLPVHLQNTCAAVVSGTDALWHAMGRNAEGIWEMTRINERGMKRWLEENALLSGRKNGKSGVHREHYTALCPQRALHSSLQGLSSAELISVEMWTD